MQLVLSLIAYHAKNNFQEAIKEQGKTYREPPATAPAAFSQFVDKEVRLPLFCNG